MKMSANLAMTDKVNAAKDWNDRSDLRRVQTKSDFRNQTELIIRSR